MSISGRAWQYLTTHNRHAESDRGLCTCRHIRFSHRWAGREPLKWSRCLLRCSSALRKPLSGLSCSLPLSSGLCR